MIKVTCKESEKQRIKALLGTADIEWHIEPEEELNNSADGNEVSQKNNILQLKSNTDKDK